MTSKIKGRGSTYSRVHRGDTPPGTHAGNNVDRNKKEIDRAKQVWQMGMAALGQGERLSKGASRAFRNAKGLLRKNGVIPA